MPIRNNVTRLLEQRKVWYEPVEYDPTLTVPPHIAARPAFGVAAKRPGFVRAAPGSRERSR